MQLRPGTHHHHSVDCPRLSSTLDSSPSTSASLLTSTHHHPLVFNLIMAHHSHMDHSGHMDHGGGHGGDGGMEPMCSMNVRLSLPLHHSPSSRMLSLTFS